MLEGLFDPKRWEITFSDMSSFLDGFSMTLAVVLLGLAISLVLGCLLGVLSTTRSRILRAVSRVYVEFFQNTPLPVQVFFYYMAGPRVLQMILGTESPVRLSAFAIGAVGVGLYHAAYVSEVIRTGIESVPRGQMEAARSQGFTTVQAYAYVILPQTFKTIIPALFSQCRRSTWSRTPRCWRLSPAAPLCTTPTTLSPPTAICRATFSRACSTL